MNKSGSNIDVAALERCFVAVKASPYPHPKFQAAITRGSPSSILVTKQQNASSCMKDARSPTPNAGGAFSHTHQLHTLELLAPRDIQAQSPKLPAIHAGRARIVAQSTDAPASHSRNHRHPAAPFLIKPSTLEENGHQDDNGNVVSSICVGLGAMGFDLYDSNFDHLESVDLGDNKIVFADTAVFPSLKMLNLYCNGIQNLEHPASAFRDLEVLNLSFNAIHPESLLPLFAMKTLVVLDLSFNTISRIPNRWHSLPLLKVLSLEKNGLHHAETFTYLSLAPSLQELNLSSNKLSSVPASCSAPGRFPQLSFISLVDNRFAHERDVVALSFVPSIQQVDLWNNPMSSNSGARTRSRQALQRSRSPSPEQKGGKQQMVTTAEQEGFLRVMTPANFNHHQYAPASSHTPAPAASYSTRPKRAMADIEREARDVFSDGLASFNDSHHHFGSTASSLRKLKSILNASLIGSNESVLISSETTVMNPTLSLIERMKVVGMDVERRKSAVPDRFFSHFYFGPDKTLASEKPCARAQNTHSEALKRMLTAVKQQHRAASHDRPKYEVLQSSAAMDRTLSDASAALPDHGAHEDSKGPKWPGYNSN